MNMRKILAVLAAALMLCAAIPMGALSVTADGAFDFEDGTVGGWLSGCNIEVVDDNGNKVLKWDASGDDWANVYYYGSAMVSANKDYVVSFRVKADRNTNINFKINNNWAGDTAAKTFDVSTEWQEYSEVINSGACTNGALLMFSSNAAKADGATYYLDDISFVEYVEPGTIINGDFETGDLSGWEKHQSTAISTDAHSGSYAANLKGDGGWGGMLNQSFVITPGKTYVVKMWVKVNANGVNIQIIDDGSTNNNQVAAGGWFTATDWTEKVYEFTAIGNNGKINFCGGGNGIAEDVLVDDITVAEKVYGQVVNGDFSNGSEGWNLSGYASVVDGAIQLDNPTQYNETLSQVVEIEPNTTYEITWKSKRVSGTGAFNLYVIQSVSPWANLTSVDGKNWMNETSGEWVANSYTVNSGDNTNMLLKFSTEGTDPGVILLDDVVVTKVIEPEQPDESIVWSVDFNDGEKKFNVGEVVAEGPDGSNCYKWDFTGGWGSNWAGGLSLDATKDYTVTMKVKGSIDSTMAITLMPGSWATWWNGPSFSVTTEWQEVVLAIPAGSTSFNTGIFEFQGTGSEPAYTLYVDDIVISEGLPELPEQSYPINGDFETGKVAPWENLWGSCPTVEIVEGGLDSDYALHIVSGKWNHVRQTAIPVEPNTWYKVTAWAKNTSDMILLVKDGGDSANLNQTGMTAGEEWTEFSGVFYTGDYTTIIISLMGGENDEVADKYGTFDNVSLEVTEEPVCEHEYEFECSTTCKLCGEETRPEAVCVSDSAPCVDGLCIYCGNDVLATAEHEYEITDGTFATCETDGSEVYTCTKCGDSYTEVIPAYHNGNLEYTAAKDPVDCATPGNIEYYYCPGCNEYFADANATEMINPWYINVTVDCVKPEGLADCADWTCEVCGNENYGSGEHDTGVPACQDGHCSKCDKDIAGYGHQNYDGPACLPGNCYYCGEAMEPVAHENGAWAPCLEGECSYGCGLTYPATAEHVDDDANGYCDTCWSVMPHDCIDEDGNYECDICYSTMPHDCIDEDGDLHCDICWGVMPHDCIDEDGDGWCDICWEMMPEEPEVVYGDANGDGIIDTLDEVLLSQYLAEWDVELDEAAADANGDGIIDTLDEVLLSQYLAEWDVTLGPV